MASHPSPTKLGRGEAWKAYQKQHKLWLPGTKPKISDPVPSETHAVSLTEPPSPPLPPSTLRRPMPKSRTMGVLSTITHTFSRSSLSSSRTKSRNVSVSTLGEQPAPASHKHSFLSLARRKSRATEPDTKSYDEEEKENTPMTKPLPIPQDPRLVFEAMPSRYWSGRFMSLHDKARSQMLEKHNLDILIEAQAVKSSVRKSQEQTTPAPINPYNNPSTSIYATTRVPPRSSSNDGTHCLRIPHSATTNAIHEAMREASCHLPSNPHANPPPYTQPPLRLSTQSIAPPSRPTPRTQHHRRSSQQCNSLNNATQRDHHNSNHPSATTAHDLAITEAAILTDDDRRCRLVLAELDALCATDAALRSFRAWQLEYARKTRRRELLPVGTTMEEETQPQQQQKRGRMTGLFMRSDGGGAGRKSESCYSLQGLGGAGGYYADREVLLPAPVPPEGFQAYTTSGHGGGEEGWRPRLRMSLSTTDAVSAITGSGREGRERKKMRIPGLLGGC